GEQHAHRDVGDRTAAHGGAQRVEHRVRPVLGGASGVLRAAGVGGLPVARVVLGAVGVDDPDGGRGEFAHPVEDGAGRGHGGVPAEVLVQGDRVERGVHPAAREQGGQGGGE